MPAHNLRPVRSVIIIEGEDGGRMAYEVQLDHLTMTQDRPGWYFTNELRPDVIRLELEGLLIRGVLWDAPMPDTRDADQRELEAPQGVIEATVIDD